MINLYLFEQVERVLWKKGFIYSPIRLMVRDIFLLCALLTVLGLASFPWTDFVLWTAAISFLSFWNIYTIAYSIQRHFPVAAEGSGNTQKSMRKKFFSLRYLKLFITTFLLYVALVWFHANVFALFLGLTLVILLMPVSYSLHK